MQLSQNYHFYTTYYILSNLQGYCHTPDTNIPISPSMQCFTALSFFFFINESNLLILAEICYSSHSAGTPVAPNNVTTTHCTVAWTPSAPGLHHKTSVCLAGTTNRLIETSCIGCSSAGTPVCVNYSITVCSSSVVNGVPCMSEARASTITEGRSSRLYQSV